MLRRLTGALRRHRQAVSEPRLPADPWTLHRRMLHITERAAELRAREAGRPLGNVNVAPVEKPDLDG